MTRTGRASIAITGVVAGLAMGLTGAAAKAPRPISFDGTCDFVGTVSFAPPLTNSPRAITQHAKGPGTCSGTLVDRHGRSHKISKAHATYVATEHGNQISCGGGTDAGKGALVFKRWGPLHFTVSETRAAAVAVLTARGTRGGTAIVTGSVDQSENPATILQACAGKGLKKVGLDGHVSTVEPLKG